MLPLFFIDRPVFAKVISVFILILGTISMFVLPVEEYPEIAPPQVNITSTYTGSSAKIVEDSVTRVLEQEINGVKGQLYMASTSSSDGTSSIDVYFESGYNQDIAAVDIQNRVARVEASLPPEVQAQGVRIIKKSNSIVLIIALKSDNPMHDALFLSNLAAISIIEELKQVKGVSDVLNFGEKKYSMRVWIDPNKMSSLGITAAEVQNAIARQNKQSPLGTFGSAPMPRSNLFQYTITGKTRLSTVKEFENIVVRQNLDGTQTHLRDVADIELGAENYGWYGKLNAGTSAGLGIYQIPGANAIDIANEIKGKLAKLKERFPEGVEMKIVYDTTAFVEASIEEVVHTLVEALVLVILVTYLFLQSVRATLIPALAIPVSLVGTFAVMTGLGFSINILSLFGLILAIGIVVDDAILVVENVEANLERNPEMTTKEATQLAMKEITGPIVATTLVLMAVFVPVTVIPGISGVMYKQFAATISFSVGISAIVALSLSPALASTLLQRHDHSKKKFIVFEKFDAGLDRFKTSYEVLLRKIINVPFLATFVFIGLLVSGYWVYKTTPQGFVPDEDKGNLLIVTFLEPGASLESTEKVSQEVTKILMAQAGIENVIEIGGYNMVKSTVDTSAAATFLRLKDWSLRTTPELQIGGIEMSLNEKFSKIDNARVLAVRIPAIDGLGIVGGFDYRLKNINGAPLTEFEDVASELIQKAIARPEISVAYTTFSSAYPQVKFDIDRDKIYKLNADISDVFNALQIYLGSLYINDFNKYGKVYRVFAQAKTEFRENERTLNTLYIRNANGKMLPLSTFIKPIRSRGAYLIPHYNTYQSITINGSQNVDAGYSSGDAMQAMRELSKELPKGYDYEWSGMSLQEEKAGNATGFIFSLCAVFVFLFLAAQYESWMMPLMIMIPIPVVLISALFSNKMIGLYNDIYAQIGMVLLMGMSCKNAILVIEFAKELRDTGMSIVDSAVNAAVLRVRAIMMTIFSFLLGILPLVIATGAGANSRRSLGTAVFGGMLVSTILTLLFTPVLFVLLERLRQRFFSSAEKQRVEELERSYAQKNR